MRIEHKTMGVIKIIVKISKHSRHSMNNNFTCII